MVSCKKGFDSAGLNPWLLKWKGVVGIDHKKCTGSIYLSRYLVMVKNQDPFVAFCPLGTVFSSV
jgi:hypothetical protein